MATEQPPPELDTSQLLACVPGLQLENFGQYVKRGVVILPDRGGKGRGSKRFYSPHDVLQVATIFELARHDVPLRDAALFWTMYMQSRILARQYPMQGDTDDMVALLVRNPATGELVVRQIHEQQDNAASFDHPDAPDVITIFRMDRFIDRVVRRIEAVLAKQPVEQPPNPMRGADPDPMGAYDTDSDGQQVLVGLTYHESRELDALMERRASYPEDHDFDAAEDRRMELYSRHEFARMARPLRKKETDNA